MVVNGYSGVNVNSFNAFFAPKGTPRPVLEKFNAALRAVLRDQDIQQKMAEMSLELAPTDLEQSNVELQKSYKFWNSATVPASR